MALEANIGDDVTPLGPVPWVVLWGSPPERRGWVVACSLER